ncbi:response regulator [Paenibacillus sp. SI8]|uniref:response regulator n=1 Tax=unclassified Paenibacillus TaxID=185978 RepID=UPI0034663CFE
MYRLLIADDEALEREGLQWIVHRMMPGTFEVIHAENGRLAIELAEEHRPHIIFMDVNMPGIQGLDALREIKDRLPDSKMVLVTAYDYFAYAKEALTLGVKEYIVKPAGREQIVHILQQLIQELDAEKRKRTEQLELRDKVSQLMPLVENELAFVFMVDQVLETGAEQLAEWLDFPLDQGCAVVLAFPELMLTQDKKKIFDVLRSYAKTHLPPNIVSSLIDRHIAIFIRKNPDIQEEPWIDIMKKYGEKLCRAAETQLGLAIIVGIGSAYKGSAGMRKSYFEAVFASAYPNNEHGVCHFHELRLGADRVTALSSTDGYAPSPDDDRAHRSYVISALQRIREEREQQTVTVLDKARRYIEHKFTEDLSLEEVAEFVHLNPHYFSKVFKQQVGETFIDFVTGLRIQKAKELIESGAFSLKEVCFEIGYKDPNYFSRVFKKVTGFTPTEYRVQPK